MSSESSTATGGRVGGIEVRSIDYVPLNERHGKVWSQGPLWFMSNAQIATLAVGTFSVTGGGNLIWSMLASLLVFGDPLSAWTLAGSAVVASSGLFMYRLGTAERKAAQAAASAATGSALPDAL